MYQKYIFYKKCKQKYFYRNIYTEKLNTNELVHVKSIHYDSKQTQMHELKMEAFLAVTRCPFSRSNVECEFFLTELLIM